MNSFEHVMFSCTYACISVSYKARSVLTGQDGFHGWVTCGVGAWDPVLRRALY
jgi:hypothetical protein